MELVIDRSGAVRCLYSEVLDLSVLGTPCIRRASHVEPDVDGKWWADLAPVDGPRLGPFESRSQALTAEIAWLEAHWLLSASEVPPVLTRFAGSQAASPQTPCGHARGPTAAK